MRTVHIGIDIGSTTTKFVVIDPVLAGKGDIPGSILYRDYARHNARQASSVRLGLQRLVSALPMVAEDGVVCRAALTGSGSRGIAEALGIPFIQEVVANSLAVAALHPEVRCAIELGGQDAKMVFFRADPLDGSPQVADMRMNGSCAGGTGAFIDEMAALLGIPVEQFDAAAARGARTYDISGRCGVFAKTDLQPLINQGVPKDDLALSTFHAIAKQTIGGLAQGLDIEPPVIFEGGPLTFNPTLIDVFAQRLGLDPHEVVRPEHPETICALGTALSLSGMFAQNRADLDLEAAPKLLAPLEGGARGTRMPPFFESDAQRRAFERRMAQSLGEQAPMPPAGTRLSVCMGVDSGSTTTKIALLDDSGALVGSFYDNNGGDPLETARAAMVGLRDDFAAHGVELVVEALGTTGYGEELFARALGADVHTVETVAHTRAATHYVPDATFVLDIGGQDMKAIWLDNGVATKITVNEACSSGCGSFLQNFASNLGIPVEGIADAAFSSTDPAALGSRCTVFMNSGIVSEQRDGKGPADIMAGLCDSIVRNVFTKVLRVSNLDALGRRIVVQGGTFQNDAVVRAFERYVDREVTRAPFPGLMGAIGVALLAQQKAQDARAANGTFESAFIGLGAIERLGYVREGDSVCPFCTNHCHRTVVRFDNGATYVTGNRCEKGEVVGDPASLAVRERVRDVARRAAARTDLFAERERLLFADYPATTVAPARDTVIGIPRVLEFWDAMPFWTTFFRALGMQVRISSPSTREKFEDSLSRVTSDTVCFPAKLVHGHVRELAEEGVDRIFMPIITSVPTENAASTSQWMCAVVKGYPMVVRNSDDPERAWGVPFDDPLFHWYTDRDRTRQLCDYVRRTFGIDEARTRDAIRQGDAAIASFRSQLVQAGASVLEQVRREGRYAVVLACRPYHNDPLVNHGVPQLLARMGVPCLPPDAVPGAEGVDLSRSLIDIVNNYHARVLSCALIAAATPELELVQLVSFGCGHDAYLSDEAVRLMRESGGKTPLVLKVDEGDARGPLMIRLRSFIETIDMRRADRARRAYAAGAEGVAAAPEGPEQRSDAEAGGSGATALESAAALSAAANRLARGLSDPYAVKYTEKDRDARVALVPNTSHAFARLMTAAFIKQGVRAEALPVGRERAIELGKRYVHNDICFPAQIVVGELLEALESGRYDLDRVAVVTGKYIGDCRLTHYGALLRKALDDAGYADVPVLTNDGEDSHDLHPGFRLSVGSSAEIALGLPMIDALEDLLRKMRPYELEPGSADAAFGRALDCVMDGIERKGIPGGIRGFRRAIDIMARVRYDRSRPRPRVLIVGEYLLNFHPGANRDIEQYLEGAGLEIVEARMTDVIRKTYFYKNAQVREYHVDLPRKEALWYGTADRIFDLAHAVCDAVGRRHPLYEPPRRMDELVVASDPIMHHTFDAGEGVLIPAEILHHAEKGCRTFVILQPFGCLPNHVCGRGITKRLKELYPDAQILPLDYDPDVSFANIENRLQMLVMNARDAT